MHALVEDGEVVLVGVALAHAVQDGEQRLVLLPENLRELDQRRARPSRSAAMLKKNGPP